MDPYLAFKQKITDAANQFRAIINSNKISGPIRIISHLDCDGISSAAILIKALENENLGYEISIIQQLSEDIVEKLAKENHKVLFFTDLGSAKLKMLSEKFSKKTIFILDHHEFFDKANYPNIIHVNPHIFSLDGGREISGAGTVFLFAHALNKKNDQMAHIAIIGAIGDIQEQNGFSKLNEEILEIAKKEKLIEVKKGLRMFGQTKMIHKMLEYCHDPFIPGVSGNESGAIQLLTDAGIIVNNRRTFKRYLDLSEDEKKNLAFEIILRRKNESCPEDIFGLNYKILNEKYDNFSDAKEFSTLLNATGRLDNASLGISVCLGDEKSKRKAIALLSEYKKEIVQAINWFNECKFKKKSEESNLHNINSRSHIISNKRYVLINAKDKIRSTIAGTLASIISKSNDYPPGVFILSMAHAPDGIKVSLRITGKNENDLRDILNEIVCKTGGETGGHKNAAGAIIPKSKEDEFILFAQELLLENSKILNANLVVSKSH